MRITNNRVCLFSADSQITLCRITQFDILITGEDFNLFNKN